MLDKNQMKITTDGPVEGDEVGYSKQRLYMLSQIIVVRLMAKRLDLSLDPENIKKQWLTPN